MNPLVTDAEVALFRAEAEARMRGTARVRRRSGRTVQDEISGREVPVWDVIEAGVPVRIAGANRGSAPTRRLAVGGVEVQVGVRVAHLPTSTQDLADGDLIEVYAGESAGSVWRVIEGDRQDQATAYRVPVLSAERPEEWA